MSTPIAPNRVIYSMEQGGFAPQGTTDFVEIHGLRSIGSNVGLNKTALYELGQRLKYASIEEVPEIELTLEKQCDGTPLLWHQATVGCSAQTLEARALTQNDFCVSIFDESAGRATGTPVAELHVSKVVPTQSTINVQLDGPVTENLTLSGIERTWVDVAGGGSATFAGKFATGTDVAPNVLQGSSVAWDALTGSPTGVDSNGMSVAWQTVLPREIRGISATGVNPADANNAPYRVVPVQSIQVSANLGRDQLRQLGNKFPYQRSLQYPIEVTTEIEVLDRGGDFISVTIAGGTNGAPAGRNTAYQTIRLVFADGTRVDTGVRNELTGFVRQGGDAQQGGSNATVRYTYTGDSYEVYSPVDPSNPAPPSGGGGS